MKTEENIHSTLSKLIISRRTYKPKYFQGAPPAKEIETLLEIARNAPNHHRTQPARFYLLDRQRIEKVGQLFGEVVRGENSSKALIEKGNRKAIEWGQAPGLLIVTSQTDPLSELVRLNPEVVEEDYATCCCICQNLLLLFEANGISAKWSTGPVWKHPDFSSVVGLKSPTTEKVVALLFYGYSDEKITTRSFQPLADHLVQYPSNAD
jgi:nitroreductase